MFDIPNSFSVRCQTPDYKSKFLSVCHKLYHGRADSENNLIYYIYAQKITYQFHFDDSDQDSTIPILHICDEENLIPHGTVKDRLCLQFCVCGDASSNRKPKEDKFMVTLYHNDITLATVQSTINYFLMLNECFPYQLHLRQELSEECTILLKRLFRSLDVNFSRRISLQSLSELNFQIFGVHLSDDDLSSIFQVLHEGDEPAFVDTVKTMTISSDEFLKIMEHLQMTGYGHTVYKFMFSSDYYLYLNPNNTYEIQGKIIELNTPAQNFITSLYSDFPDQPTREQLIELFLPNGGAPARLTNLRMVREADWLDMWNNWFRSEPNEVARHLLAFGFPSKMIQEAFTIEPEQTVAPVAVTAAGLTAIAFGLGFLLMQFRRR
ncbi:hypothetical protein TRFO_37135 [Tritrichomonas foetus]|uniref:EF-hand domain-containing protein n=1 Tax=Tritrichomonas foetus TaxID=1144522 RepID=A0A1J4JEB8_9EUKA|nr:hypothetical protein TRFO_37135 [Tritrichomonas foetus]|eukprot:OHS96639.1 hypothetical protein TRFO_37135 [Tritrichomonas foetus]